MDIDLSYHHTANTRWRPESPSHKSEHPPEIQGRDLAESRARSKYRGVRERAPLGLSPHQKWLLRDLYRPINGRRYVTAAIGGCVRYVRVSDEIAATPACEKSEIGCPESKLLAGAHCITIYPLARKILYPFYRITKGGRISAREK